MLWPSRSRRGAVRLGGVRDRSAHARLRVRHRPGRRPLPAEEEQVESRLQELTDNSSADLFVVLVDDFTDPSDSVDWADQVANDNRLGPEQYLLAIAVEGRSLYISADSSGPLSDGQLAAIEDAIAPLAGSGDWVGAITLAADEIQGTAEPERSASR